MKDFDKLDIVTYAILFVTIISLVAMGFVQSSIKKDVLLLLEDTSKNGEYGQYQTGYSQQDYINTQLYSTYEASTEAVTDFETHTSSETQASEAFSQEYYDAETTLPTVIEQTTRENTTSRSSLVWWTSKVNANTTQTPQTVTQKAPQLDTVFVYSKNSDKLHSRSCPYALKIKEENIRSVDASQVQELLDKGYTFCSHCQGYVIEE